VTAVDRVAPLSVRVEKSDSLSLSDFMRGQYYTQIVCAGIMVLHTLGIWYCPRIFGAEIRFAFIVRCAFWYWPW
jgi:hypothetical protein